MNKETWFITTNNQELLSLSNKIHLDQQENRDNKSDYNLTCTSITERMAPYSWRWNQEPTWQLGNISNQQHQLMDSNGNDNNILTL